MAYMAVTTGVVIGALLGGLNVAMVAVVLSVIDKRREADTIMTLHELPGNGAASAPVAQLAAMHARRRRSGAVIVAAVGVTLALSWLVGMQVYVAVASLPTVIAALWVERWTRRSQPASIPVATARAIVR